MEYILLWHVFFGFCYITYHKINIMENLHIIYEFPLPGIQVRTLFSKLELQLLSLNLLIEFSPHVKNKKQFSIIKAMIINLLSTLNSDLFKEFKEIHQEELLESVEKFCQEVHNFIKISLK